MKNWILIALIALLFVGAMLAGRFLNPLNQAVIEIERLEPVWCEPAKGPCVVFIDDGTRFQLEILPKEKIQPMQPLEARVSGSDDMEIQHLTLTGVNMDMGFNRFNFHEKNGYAKASLIIPVCTLERMEWEAAVQVMIGEKSVIFPFLFAVERN